MLKIPFKKINRRIKWEFDNLLHKKNRVIFNINLDINNIQQRKLAFVYLDHSLLNSDFSSATHTSISESSVLIKLFIDQGFCIDVIDVFQNPKMIYEKLKDKQYDCIFGFSSIFDLLAENNPRACKIMYCTENEPCFSLTEEKKRLDYYKLRHGKNLPIKRSGTFYHEKHFNNIDCIVTLSDNSNFIKYEKTVYETNPTGLINKHFDITDIKENRHSNYLWFGSSGVIHKGLDILVEAFNSMPQENHLYVYGLADEDEKLLDITNSNIHLRGRISVESKEFIDVVKKCNYIILPSCSEAMSTAVLTGMLHGLIPIVTKDAGMNRLGENVIYIESHKVEALNILLRTVNNTPVNVVFQKKIEVYKYAHKHFKIEQFKTNMTKIIRKILEH